MADEEDIAGLRTQLALVEQQLADSRQVEEALRETAARHRLLIESWAQAQWETDADGVVVADSPSWRAYTGQSLDEWLGYGWLDAIHPDDRAYAGRQWAEAMAAQGFVNAEIRLRAPDGGWRWTNVRAAPVRDGAGKVRKWAGMNIDIHARKCAETALTASEEKYRFLFERMDEAYAVLEVLKDDRGEWADFRFLDANRAFMQHTSMPYPVGKTGTELLGSPNARWTELYGQALDCGEPLRVQEVEHMLDRTFDLNIFTLDRDRNQVAVLFTDITARAKAEAALLDRESRLRIITDAMPALISYMDTDVRYRFGNRRYEEWFGHKPEEIEGRHARDLLGDAAYERLRPYAEAALAGQRQLFEEEMPFKGIGTRHVRSEFVPDVRGDGSVAGYYALVVDISERKRAEEALRANEERLRNAAEVAKFGLWDWDIRNGTVVWSDEHYRMEGYAVGEVVPSYGAWAERVHPEDLAATEAAIVAARDTRTEYRHEFRSLHPDGSIRWHLARGRFYYNGDGHPTRMIGAMLDTTERREGEERQKILLAELQHRVRNILAVIRSMVSRSNDGERSTDEYVHHLQGRIAALARTQVLLTRRAGVGVDLEEMIRDELVAQAARDEQFSLGGPRVEISPKAAEVLTLAIHELATNAIKYGAFARPGGRLQIGWTIEPRQEHRWLVLDWVERGVPVVDAVPRRQGFGSELIARRIPYELKGNGSFSLRPGGLYSRIEFPLSAGNSILQTDEVVP